MEILLWLWSQTHLWISLNSSQLDSIPYHTQTLWIVTASIALIALTKAKDDTWQRTIPIKFLKAVMEQPTLCETGYADYDSCENTVTTNSVKRLWRSVNRFSIITMKSSIRKKILLLSQLINQFSLDFQPDLKWCVWVQQWRSEYGKKCWWNDAGWRKAKPFRGRLWLSIVCKCSFLYIIFNLNSISQFDFGLFTSIETCPREKLLLKIVFHSFSVFFQPLTVPFSIPSSNFSFGPT